MDVRINEAGKKKAAFAVKALLRVSRLETDDSAFMHGNAAGADLAGEDVNDADVVDVKIRFGQDEPP